MKQKKSFSYQGIQFDIDNNIDRNKYILHEQALIQSDINLIDDNQTNPDQQNKSLGILKLPKQIQPIKDQAVTNYRKWSGQFDIQFKDKREYYSHFNSPSSIKLEPIEMKIQRKKVRNKSLSDNLPLNQLSQQMKVEQRSRKIPKPRQIQRPLFPNIHSSEPSQGNFYLQSEEQELDSSNVMRSNTNIADDNTSYFADDYHSKQLGVQEQKRHVNNGLYPFFMSCKRTLQKYQPTNSSLTNDIRLIREMAPMFNLPNSPKIKSISSPKRPEFEQMKNRSYQKRLGQQFARQQSILDFINENHQINKQKSKSYLKYIDEYQKQHDKKLADTSYLLQKDQYDYERLVNLSFKENERNKTLKEVKAYLLTQMPASVYGPIRGLQMHGKKLEQRLAKDFVIEDIFKYLQNQDKT